MKKAALLFCFALSVFRLSAQKINVDSLIRVAIAQSKGSPFKDDQNRDSLFKLLAQAKSPHQRINLIYKIINYGQGLSKDGLNYHYKILNWAKENKDDISKSVISSELGFQTALNGDVAEGISAGLSALQMAQKTKNDEAIGIAYDCLGCSYGYDALGGNTSSISASMNSFRLGLKFAKLGHNDIFIAYDYGGVGTEFNANHKTDSAIFYTLKSFEYAVIKNIPIQAAHSLLDLGDEEKDNRLKLKYYQAGAKIAAHSSTIYALSIAYVSLGHLYKGLGQTDSAMFYANKAYAFTNNEAIGEKIEPALLLDQLYSHDKRNVDSALKYTNIYHAAKDSMFSIGKAVRAQAVIYADQRRMQEIETQKSAYAATLRLYILGIVIAFLLLIAFIFWRNNGRIKKDKIQIQQTLDQLKATQNQLIQSEKMASLGELTAGIAHEIQNPLNFVNNFSDVSVELLDEMQLELTKGDKDEAIAIAEDIKQNLEKIRHHGKRAEGIVKGMLQHSRASSNTKELTDINKLADEYLRLAYHGLRAKDKSFNAELVTNFAEGLPKVNIVPQDIGRVLLNILNNAFYATHQKQQTANESYKPEVAITTLMANNHLLIVIRDNGSGIPDAIKEKIMQPFFTTKPTGDGTGLGLSLSYDIIVKGHNGTINVNSKDDAGSEFTVSLPV